MFESNVGSDSLADGQDGDLTQPTPSMLDTDNNSTSWNGTGVWVTATDIISTSGLLCPQANSLVRRVSTALLAKFGADPA